MYLSHLQKRETNIKSKLILSVCFLLEAWVWCYVSFSGPDPAWCHVLTRTSRKIPNIFIGLFPIITFGTVYFSIQSDQISCSKLIFNLFKATEKINTFKRIIMQLPKNTRQLNNTHFVVDTVLSLHPIDHWNTWSPIGPHWIHTWPQLSLLSSPI